MGASCLLLIDKSLLGQRLAGRQLQSLPPFPLNGYLRKTCQVLAHVENQYAVVSDGVADAKALHDFNGLCYLFAQYAARGILNDGWAPVVRGDACVVVFAAIDAVERDGRQCPLP